jgi:hypothetical protein
MSRTRKSFERVLRELGFPSPEAALGEITLLGAADRLAQFREECARFEKKHGMTFERFRRRVEKGRGRESFADEEDLMAWQFAREGVEYWTPRVDELRRAV